MDADSDADEILMSARAASRLIMVEDFDEVDEVDDEDLFDDDDDDGEDAPAEIRERAPAAGLVDTPPDWQQRLQAMNGGAAHRDDAAANPPWPENRRIIYGIDLDASLQSDCLVVQLGIQDRKRDGTWVYQRHQVLTRENLPRLPPEDGEILAALAGGSNHAPAYAGYRTHQAWPGPASSQPLPAALRLGSPLAGMLLPRMVATLRCVLKTEESWDSAAPLAWDQGGAWEFRVGVDGRDQDGWLLSGRLRRGDDVLDAQAPLFIAPEGFVITDDLVAPLAPASAATNTFAALRQFRQLGPITVPDQDGGTLLAALLATPLAPHLELPEELRFREEVGVPVPGLSILPNRSPWRQAPRLEAVLEFDYGDWRVAAADGAAGRYLAETPGHYVAETRCYLRRDFEAERAAARLLPELGFRFRGKESAVGPRLEGGWALPPSKLPKAARALVESGWRVEAEGKLFRRAGAHQLSVSSTVSSGIDWFELRGEVDYDGARAQLPALLEALRKGESMVALDDGSFGMLPEEWLRSLGGLAGLGQAEGDHVRFRSSQAGLLDALLALEPQASCDATFARARRQLDRFEGITAPKQPSGFRGQLRDYQRLGLGWLLFLRRFGLGGCLADDMGVGKTAQALALLEMRRATRGADAPTGPALIVAPRSLIFNWKQEAARFTPQLRLLDYTGAGRGHEFSTHDAVLTTYGTLRREILRLKAIDFDTIVLDEAQAIKNAATASAKAARLLRGRQRLALSGTPVENHIGELWSLFEFLNPGMLGTAAVFQRISDGRGPQRVLDCDARTAARPAYARAGLGAPAPQAGAAPENNSETRQQIARALRPMILRRTKQQVARELPEKTEQTLVCGMQPPQRRLYDELRAHYRRALLGQVDRVGMAKSKIQVLEALLRLRQAACHPGLIDPKRHAEPSAKLDTLLEQLREVLDEGHKALVFSQFTSMLRIVRDRLDAAGVVYEYLDGRTRDRQAKVERFQTDPACKLFLISLKAGGLGLNLTAADYVFLLDPWWNPAVEAQAVDRAHRIGQTRRVFAYRLIVHDSIEEKVLALQDTKRDLAAVLIGGSNNLMRDLRREDLEALLS
ncbi:MAG TPA: SNF2-related protein [Terriglobales bacterium]|nr:SNF2-related protein [Terriglobales bacterium]